MTHETESVITAVVTESLIVSQVIVDTPISAVIENGASSGSGSQSSGNSFFPSGW